MHENNIILLRDEALRLIELEKKTLAAMCDAPGLLTQEKQEQVQTLDQQSAKNHMDILDGEKIKLKNLDMVLAVVGTMKAGKSTTINAIVGTEVLPNRNGPMTAIPTLIRHTPGQTDPQLTLPHLEPIEDLRTKIHARLTGKKGAEILNIIPNSNKDLHELAHAIKNGVPLKAHYTGADEIFHFLKGLNDLVRLAQLLKLEFPFKEFSNVDKLPIICVEFSHLSSDASAAGTLTLLDTPGPNEAKQAQQLLPMLKEQLRKASAILAVFDYTQLTSEADAQVRTCMR
jgi:replication fork clamp-binding protein CrfC